MLSKWCGVRIANGLSIINGKSVIIVECYTFLGLTKTASVITEKGDKMYIEAQDIVYFIMFLLFDAFRFMCMTVIVTLLAKERKNNEKEN